MKAEFMLLSVSWLLASFAVSFTFLLKNTLDSLIAGEWTRLAKWSLKFHLSIIVVAVDLWTAVGDWLPVGIIFWEAYSVNNKTSIDTAWSERESCVASRDFVCYYPDSLEHDTKINYLVFGTKFSQMFVVEADPARCHLWKVETHHRIFFSRLLQINSMVRVSNCFLHKW